MQAKTLDIWEKNALPIPDIAAQKNEALLLVEVDHRFQMACSSFARYRDADKTILHQIGQACGFSNDLNILLLGFCKIGPLQSAKAIIQSNVVDFLSWFDDPMEPSVWWAESFDAFKD